MPDRPNPAPESLRSLYHETWAEIARLRDSEWKITYYFVSLNAASIVLFLTQSFSALLTTPIRILFTAAAVMTLLFAIYHLQKTHGYLTEQRNIRRRIEELLHLFEAPAGQPDAVLPAKWKGVTVPHSFQRAELVIPLMATVVVAHILTLYVVWRVH